MALFRASIRPSLPFSPLRYISSSSSPSSPFSSSAPLCRFRRRLVSLRPSGVSVCCRLGSFTSQCYVTKPDIDTTEVATTDVVTKDAPLLPSGCSMPFVHLSTEILSSELQLLTEETYTTSLLTTLPVLSKEEQDALVATPAHPSGLVALYVSFFLGNLSEHLWDFTWPASVAMLHPNLVAVAVVSFFTKLAVLIGGPLIGSLMDSLPRIPSYNCLNLVQTVAQLISSAMIIYALDTVRHSTISSLLCQPWFLVLVGAIATEKLAKLAIGVSMERDWIVMLAGTDRPIALSKANAMFSRVDLFCEAAGASLFSFLSSKHEPATCIKLACALSICSMPLLIVLGHLTNGLSRGVLDRSSFPQTCVKPLTPTSPFNMKRLGESSDLHHPVLSPEIEMKYLILPKTSIVQIGLAAIRQGWTEYKHQPVLPASLAYVLLCFNIALAPGAIMTTFLMHQGIAPSVIGAFGGLSAFMGVAATFLSAKLVRELGILKAGAAGLLLQSLLLTLAVAVYWSGSISMPGPLFFFLSLIVLSRLGHMSYSIASIQILQTGIPTAKANLVGTTEISIASFAELVMLGVVIIASDARHFGLLAMLSVFSVVGATCLFCQWLANPTDEQRSLFAFVPQF